MSNNIAGLKPGTRRVFYAAVVSIISCTSSSCMMILQTLNQVQRGGFYAAVASISS